MRTYKFSIYFTGNGEEVVHASGMTDALILACANRINKGLHINAFDGKNWDREEGASFDGSRPALSANFYP